MSGSLPGMPPSQCQRIVQLRSEVVAVEGLGTRGLRICFVGECSSKLSNGIGCEVHVFSAVRKFLADTDRRNLILSDLTGEDFLNAMQMSFLPARPAWRRMARSPIRSGAFSDFIRCSSHSRAACPIG